MRHLLIAILLAAPMGACNFDKDRHLEGQPSQQDRSKEQHIPRAADDKTARQGWEQREVAKQEANISEHKVLELDQEINALISEVDRQGTSQAQCSQFVADLRPYLSRIREKMGELKDANAGAAVGVLDEKNK